MSEPVLRYAIALSEPEISGNEWKYVKECLDTQWVSSVGGFVDRFEGMVAGYLGTKYAVATVNGTSALHISLIACGVGPGDEVMVPTLTFVAPVNTVRYCRAYPVFFDSDRTLCIDVNKVSDFLLKKCRKAKDGFTYNRQTKRRVRAIIPVHVFGHPVDMKPLCDIAKKYNILVIEDATESLGSEYKGKKTGVMGKTGCLSFNGNKIMTTGSGGMVVTNDARLANKIRHLTTQAKKKHPFEYDHDHIGYNYRLTNVQAALGVAQLERLDEFIKIKRRNALLYRELLREIEGVDFIWEQDYSRSNFWFYTIRVAPKFKNPLIKYLLSRNIQVRPLWKLVHTLPMYRTFQRYSIENALSAYETCINLPCSVGLREQDVKRVVENIHKFMNTQKEGI